MKVSLPVLVVAAFLAAAGCSAPAGAWRPAERLSVRFLLPADRVGRFAPRLAGNRAGDAMVVWVQEEPGARLWSVRARRWRDGRWGPERRVVHGGGDLPLDRTPAAVVDDSGGAVVSWEVSGAVWSARFRPDGGWERPLLAEGSGEGAATAPALAARAGGEVVLVWARERPYGGEIRLRRLVPGHGWTAPATLATEFSAVGETAVATGPGGGIAAAWTLAREGRDRLRFVRTGPEGGWGGAVDLDTMPDPADRYDEACCWTFGSLRLGLPAAGEAVVAWRGRFRGAVGLDVPSLWSQRLADGKWTLTRIEAVAERHVELLSEAWSWGGGELFVAWREEGRWPVAGVTRSLLELQARRALPGGSWESAHSLMQRDAGPGTEPPPDAPALTAAADVAWIAWTGQAEEGWTVAAARWEPGLGWHPPEQVGPASPGHPAMPAVAMAGPHLLVAWLVLDEESGWQLVASRRRARPD